MPASVEALNLPFPSAIEYFRRKVNLPTERWTDLWEGMHSRAFVVAGATKTALLADLRTAVDKAIAKGTSLAEFRRDFEEIAARHGWKFKGDPGWRAATIYNTNLATAYAAGHYAQMSDPDVLRFRPYWRYVPSTSKVRRIEHMQWYNLVLPADHEFWKTHYPPNGWGCKCGVVSHSQSELDRLQARDREAMDGGQGVDFPIRTTAPDEGTYDWTDKRTGEVKRIPKGIDPGWAYNPGRAAWGEQLSQEAMDAWRAQKGAAWDRLTPGDWETEGRPARIPVDEPKTTPGPKLTTVEAATDAIREIMGGDQRVFSFQAGDYRHDLVVNAASLASHIDLARTPVLPFLVEALEDPFEVWMAFEQHKGTGRVELRQRIIKALPMGKKEAMLVVAQAVDGVMEAWTVIPQDRMSYMNRQRVGKLVWGRK